MADGVEGHEQAVVGRRVGVAPRQLDADGDMGQEGGRANGDRQDPDSPFAGKAGDALFQMSAGLVVLSGHTAAIAGNT